MTVCSSNQRRKRKVTNKIKLQRLGNHDEFLNRITKTLYYGKIPLTDRFSLPVTELAAELFSEVKKDCSLERLHVDEAAEISRNACVSPCSLVLALLYLERLKTCNSEYVERVSPSELFLVSMMVASKFLHDLGDDEVYNDEWATSGGLELKDLNRLEREFLNAINWEVYVSSQVFWTRLRGMEATLALREGRRRGWFSYTELTQLVNTTELLALANTLLTVSAVCLTSYTASVLAMVGSTIMVNQVPAVATDLVMNLRPNVLFTPPVYTPAYTHGPDLAQCLLNVTEPVQTCCDDQPLYHFDLDQGKTRNHSFKDEDEILADLTVNHLRIKQEWSEQKDWLTAITRLAPAPPFPYALPQRELFVPIDILSY